MKMAVLTVVWQDYETEPLCEIRFAGTTTDDERHRLLTSLAHALLARYPWPTPSS